MVEEKGSYGLLRGWQHRRHNEVTLSSLPRLDGKVALITGANSGIGKVATQFLARRGAKVFMACRSKTKAEEAITEIHRDVPDADLEFLPYDASSLSAVHSEALSFLDRNIPLDILLLNAGAIVENPQPSKDGLEWMFAINHLAHFMLAITLLPALEKAALQSGGGDVRAVCTTSAGFTMHPDKDSLHISDEDLNIEDPEQWWWEGTMPMYGRSKTCNILFATELNRRLRAKTTWGKKMRSNAIHPGTVSTGLNLQVRSRLTKFLERVVYSLVAVSVLILHELAIQDEIKLTCRLRFQQM
ncbi:hypothetical protein ACLMJK_002114 [Lecanora helva]